MAGMYRTIVADPPWPGNWFSRSSVRNGEGGGRRRAIPSDERYPLMPMAKIEALPVSDLGTVDANLFLWVPARLNREGIGVQVARAWGFEPRAEIVWEKTTLGQGRFPRICHEILLVCSRGQFTLTGPWGVRSVQHWRAQTARTGNVIHSGKPDGALDLIEQHSPGPYVELFARRHRLGWDVIGDHFDERDISEVLNERASIAL